jgi:hypothetical protein
MAYVGSWYCVSTALVWRMCGTGIVSRAGMDGSVMLPVLSETGSLVAYLLSADPPGMLRVLYCSRALLDNC